MGHRCDMIDLGRITLTLICIIAHHFKISDKKRQNNKNTNILLCGWVGHVSHFKEGAKYNHHYSYRVSYRQTLNVISRLLYTIIRAAPVVNNCGIIGFNVNRHYSAYVYSYCHFVSAFWILAVSLSIYEDHVEIFFPPDRSLELI